MNTAVSPRDYLLLLGVGLIWSSSFLFIKLAISTVPPYTLTAARIAVAVVILAGYLTFKRQGLPTDIKNWTIFAVLGLFGTALPFTLISWGEVYIDSGLTAVLMGTMPVATAMLAHLFIADERFNFGTGLGIMIGFGGLIILIGVDALHSLDTGVIAQFAIIIGAVSYAVSTAFARRFARLPGPVMSTGSTLAGLIWVLPMAILLELPWTLHPDGMAVISVLILGIVATVLAQPHSHRLTTSFRFLVQPGGYFSCMRCLTGECRLHLCWYSAESLSSAGPLKIKHGISNPDQYLVQFSNLRITYCRIPP